jgi:hypothetical protein
LQLLRSFAQEDIIIDIDININYSISINRGGENNNIS